jgi:hypothetical protein
MGKMFTDKMDETDWVVESKGKVKLLTIFQEDGILSYLQNLHRIII